VRNCAVPAYRLAALKTDGTLVLRFLEHNAAIGAAPAIRFYQL
jgi:hypothetical protein